MLSHTISSTYAHVHNVNKHIIYIYTHTQISHSEDRAS
jgi:hypothetical protein